MTTTTCNIEFHENPYKIYYGGQVLHGKAILTLHKSKTVRGIYVKIEGKAHCEWETGGSKSAQTHIGAELYFSEKTYFVGAEEGGGEEVEVQPGIYTYTFQCNLPYTLPTSLEAEYGHIRYTVMLNLDRPYWPDQEFIEPFTVIKPLNLNLLPGLDTPSSIVNELTYNKCCCWCCCFPTDPITITGHIPKTGYTPGEEININITVDNKSMDIPQFIIGIVKIIDYYTRSRTKREEISVIEKNLTGVVCNKIQTFDSSIEVPPIPPTDTDSSDICKVTYVVRIYGDVDLCSDKSPQLDMPITIGTYPLNVVGVRPSQGLQPAPPITHQPMPMSERVDRPIIASDNPSAPLLSEDPPPTYEEAAGIQANINGNVFKPRYLVYRRTNSTANYNN